MNHLRRPSTWAAGAVAGALVLVGVLAVYDQVNQPPDFVTWPAPGTYDWPETTALKTETQTFRVNIAGAVINVVDVLGVNAGPPSGSATTTLLITANSGSYIEVDELVLSNGACPNLTLQDVEAFYTTIQDNEADGNSITFTVTTTEDIVVGSTRGEVPLVVSDETPYDRVWIDGGSGAQIRTFTVDSFAGRGGDCLVERLKVGRLDVSDWLVGKGDGLAAADLDLNLKIGGAATSTNNAERNITIR